MMSGCFYFESEILCSVNALFVTARNLGWIPQFVRKTCQEIILIVYCGI